jgi:hypothetical protein
MRDAGVGRRGVKPSLVWTAGGDRIRQLVVDLENEALRAVFAMRLHVLAPDDRERVHYVVDIVFREAVEMEEGGV